MVYPVSEGVSLSQLWSRFRSKVLTYLTDELYHPETEHLFSAIFSHQPKSGVNSVDIIPASRSNRSSRKRPRSPDIPNGILIRQDNNTNAIPMVSTNPRALARERTSQASQHDAMITGHSSVEEKEEKFSEAPSDYSTIM